MDRYTKTMLTVIAVSLFALAIEHAAAPAQAQPTVCGRASNEPCYIEVTNPVLWVKPE
jgi:hypothetical protein